MKLHVQLQCKNLHQYLKELSPEILDRLYNHPATCLAVYRYHTKTTACLCAQSFRLHCAVCVVCRSPQRAALSVQELCDANAVPGPAAPPGSCVVMGQQSEVGHDQCWKLKRQLISTVHIGKTFIVSTDGNRAAKGSVTFHWFILFAIWNRSKN